MLSGLACAPATPEQPAELVLLNGTIETVDEALGTVEALATRGGRIVAVGTRADIETLIGPDTEIMDLEGQFAVPGLIEGHGHYMSYGASLRELELRHATSWSEIVGLVEEAAQAAEPGTWIVGRGWHQDKWTGPTSPNVEGLPLHDELSAVSPDNPVFLSHTSGHGVFVNLRAMQAAGVDADSSDPPGGEIVRDSRGAPTGMLREAAADPARKALADYRATRSAEQIEREARRDVQLAAEDALRHGITSFQDMGSSFEQIDLLKQMAEEGALPIRLYLAIQETAVDMEGKLDEYRLINHGDHFLTVRAIGEKVLDGALGTHGGWLLEPYSDLPRTVGFNVTPVEDIQRSAELAIEHGYQMAIQGIGDKAARVLFDIYEQQFDSHPEEQDTRWRIEHAQVIHPDDLPRFASMGVIPGIQGIFACSDGPWVVDRLGPDRAEERGYLYQSMIQAGALVMNGTDPPVEPIDPIASFYCSVSRVLPDGSLFFPEQAMTRRQALESYTINNAYAAFEDDIKGTLSPGKLADITVLSDNLMTIPEEKIPSVEVIHTIVGGIVRYSRDDRP